jgi:phosphohistidine phosphatase
MIVNLLRHAKAEKGAPETSDTDRKLTAKGRTDAFKRAGKLRKKLRGVTAIVTSPAPRALETAEIFSAVLKKSDLLIADEALLPPARAEDILRHLRNFTKHAEILVVGHEPWLTGLASLLFSGTVQANIRLKKPGLIRLDVEMMAPGGAALLSLS